MLSWSHHPEPPPYPVPGCYRNQLHSIDSQKLEQTEAGNQTCFHEASGRSDFGYSGTIWQMAHWTAGALWLILAVHLKSAQALQGLPARCGTSRIHLHHTPVTRSNHLPWVVYTPSACPACVSMSFEICPQEILNNLQFLVSFRIFVLPAGAKTLFSSR